MSGGVLVAGTINTDLVARVHKAPEAGETVTGTAFNIFGGGKGANQALAAARSGAPTTMLGALGDDDFGRQRLADLRADGIDVESVAVVPGIASGVALITVEDGGENRIAYVPGATATVQPEAAIAAFERVRPSIVLATLELPLPALRSLFEAARAAGTRVIVNATPEPRSGLDLLPLVDTLIVNETEAFELVGAGRDSDPVTIAEQLRALGPSWVIITLGKDGVVANIDGRVILLPALTVDVVDTTGAGDAFCGAFAARLAASGDAGEALRAGIAAGALAVTVEGAQRSMPRQADIERMMASIERSPVG